jgi:hypothetical protein
MQIELFKFYLRQYNTGTLTYEYFYLDANGDVQITTTKTALPQAPQGWQEMELKWERGFTYHGVFTNYTTPLKFVLDGGKILRYGYYNTGIETSMELFIEKHTNEVATWGYDDYYIGDIDFSRFKDMKDFVQIEIMESGFIKNLKAKEDSTLEIDVEQNADKIFVMMDGIDLQATAEFTSIDQPRYDTGTIDSVGEANGALNIIRKVFPTLLFYGELKGYGNGDIYCKGNDYLGNNKTPAVTNNTATFDVSVSPYFILQNTSQTISYDINLVGLLTMASVNNAGGAGDNITPQIRVWNVKNLVVVSTTVIAVGSTLSPNFGVYQGQQIGVDATITVAPNEYIYIVVEHTHTNSVLMDSTMHFYSFELSINWLNKIATSYIPVIPMQSVATPLIENIDANYTLTSQPIIDKEDDYFLTSGDGIRGLANSKIKTTWMDFYNAMNCMFNTAFYYDKSIQTAYIDYKANVYDNGFTSMSLGNVAKMDVAPLTQEMFNKLKIGYKPFSYDEINGKEEFNTEYEFQSPITRVVSEKNLVSPYRADMYGIELTRANLTDKLQADSDMDNDVFWIHVDKTITGTIPAGYPNAGATYYGLYRDAAIITQGLISPSTAFNIEFSPKRRMLAFGNWIKSVTYPSPGDMTFNTSSKTTDTSVGLGTDDGVTIIIEKDTIAISDLTGTTLFYPLVFTIDVKIPQNILALLTASPYGEIDFEWLGNTYYGFLLEVSDSPTYTPKQTYRLIATTNNTLSNLIV